MMKELTKPLNYEVDTVKNKIHLSEYGEHIITLSFEDIDCLKEMVDYHRLSQLGKIMNFFKKVVG